MTEICKLLASEKKCIKEDPEKENKSWIQVYNKVVFHYLLMLMASNDPKVIEEYSKNIMGTLSKSDRLDVLDSSLFVVKGWYLFYEGSIDNAINYFDNAIEYHPQKKVPLALIGQACIDFYQRKYAKSLRKFNQVCELNPRLTHKLTYALGCCYFNLGKFNQAKKLFNSVLKNGLLECEGNLALAIVEKKQNNYKDYFEYLEKAYKSSSKNPQVMLELAEHYLIKNDLERAVKIARYGLICSERLLHTKSCRFKSKTRKDYNEMKSRFNYIIAHRYHHQKRYKEALNFYNISITLYPNNFEAQFGLGQIHLSHRDWKSAYPCFNYIVTHCKKTEAGECFKILGYLSSKLKKKDEACEFYEKAISFNSNDYESMIEYASIMETMDPTNALTLYTQSVKTIEEINLTSAEWEEKIFIHPEILLNIATLKFKIGLYQEAEEDFQSLMVTVKDYLKMTKNEKYQAMMQTLKFNMGCLQEAQGNILSSIETFEEILQENPLNLDAMMKLSHIYLNLGKLKEAESCSSSMTQVMDLLLKKMGREKFQNKLAESICFQSFISFKLGKHDEAINSVDQIRAKCNFDDPYGKLLQAAIIYEKSVKQRNLRHEQKKHLKSVTQIAKNVLKSDESNYFSAMVLGITFAESAHLSTAWKIFSSLLESCEFEEIFMINSAKLAMLMRKYETAIAVFTNYLENNATVYEDNCETLLGLAYLKNKFYEEAKRIYQRLILKYPGDHAHRLNLLTIYQEETGNLMRQDHRLIHQTESGLKNLKIMQHILEYLHEYCKAQQQSATEQQTMKPETIVDSESDSSINSRAFESDQAKFSRLVEEKLKWGAAKLTLLEKMYAQEQETLKLRQLIRNERHSVKKEAQPSLDEKRKEQSIEERAREMLRFAQEMKDEQLNKRNLRLSSKKMRGLKLPKEAKGPTKPREPKPKKLPKKFHLRYFLMDGETTKQRNQKKRKSGSDDEEEDDDMPGGFDEDEEEEEAEEEAENEDEDDFPEGFMGFDEPEANNNDEDDEDQRKRLDETYIEDVIARENKSAKSSTKRSAEPKMMGNRSLNNMIRNFIYTDTKDEPKKKKKRRLNNGEEKENESDPDADADAEEIVMYQDDEEENNENDNMEEEEEEAPLEEVPPEDEEVFLSNGEQDS